VGLVRICVRALMRVLKPDSEAGSCSSNVLLFYCLSGMHATNRVIVFFLICNKNLAYGEGTKIDGCDVVSAASELDMTIITLGRLYSVLSCWLAPIDVVSVQHGRHVEARPQTFDWVTPSSGVDTEAVWVRLFSATLQVRTTDI
jgi:hypothetical protein